MSENLIIIGNKRRNHCVNNEKLSWKAKGVHSYFISRPEIWEIRHNDLFNRSTDGMEGTKTGINELLAQKYIYRIHKNSSQGMSWGYLVFDCPTNKNDAETELNEIQPDYFIKELGIKRPTMVKPNSGETNSGINKGKVNNNELGNSKIKLFESSKDDSDFPKKLENQNYKKSSYGTLKQRISESLQKRIISPKVKELIDFYSSTIHNCKPESKSYLKSIETMQRLMKGTFFKNMDGRFAKYKDKKFTPEEIKGVIDRILIASSSPDYFPSNKIHLKKSFDTLVFNQFNPNEIYKSTFLYFYENEPKYLGNGVSLMDNPHPLITNTFKTFYEDCVVAGTKQNYTNVQENKFREASRRAVEFYQQHRERMHINNERAYALAVLDGIKDSIPLKSIEIGTLCSKRTWEKIIPVYLADQGILDQVRIL